MLLLILALAQNPAAAPAAELVAPGVINTDGDEYGPTLTADGSLLVFTRRADRRGAENIVISRWVNGAWTAPETAPFSGQGLDKEPYLSPDGRRLFFASMRTYPGKGDSAVGRSQGFDLFVVERTANGWGQPQPVTGANSPNYDNYPAVARNGNLYFASYRLTNRNDLFVYRPGTPAEALTALNTPQTDADPFIAPDESYIIFSSDRPGGSGSGDLYVSFRNSTGWTAPVSLGPLVNTGDYEYTPFVTADGRWLWFSRGWGEIWRIEVRHLEALRR